MDQSSNNTITKVYDLQMIGGKDAYNTLQGINTLFKEIAANKGSLNGINGTFNINADLSKLEGINRAFLQMVATNKELILNVKLLTSEMSRFGQVGQQMTSSVSASMGKVNMANLQNIVGFQKFTGSISSAALTAEDYGAIMLALQAKMSELTAAIRDNATAAVENRKQYNNGLITEEEYNAIIGQITASQFELKASLAATGKELATLTQLWNATAESAAESNQQVAANKVILSEHNIELKQQAKLMMAAEGSIDQMAVKLGLLRNEYRALSVEERESAKGRGMLYQIQSLDAQVKALDKSIGNSQRNVGNYGSAFEQAGSKLRTFIVRDLFRATAGFVVFNLLFEGAQKLWDSLPGKVDKARQSMDNFTDSTTKQLDEFIELQKAINAYFSAGDEGYKRITDSVKAKGVVNGEVYKHEQEVFEAEQAQRAKELEGLGAIQDKYKQVQDIFLSYDKGGDLNAARKQLTTLGLAPEDLKKFNDDIDNYLKAKAKLKDKDKENFKLSENNDLFKKQSAVQDQIYNKEAEIENAKTEMLAKQEELRYNKNIELAAQLVQVREQRRQTEEQEEINSVAKITRDVKAKYNIMYDEIHKKMLELAKQFPDDKLPADLQKKYDEILNNVRKIEQADLNNQTIAFNRAERLSNVAFNAAEAQSGADIAKFFADNGHIDYGGMSEAIDKEETAKRAAEENNFEQTKEQYRLHNRSTEELEKFHQDALNRIELEGYQAREQLAAAYYNKIQQQISAANDLAIEKIQTNTINKVTSILNGTGSSSVKSELATKAQQYGIIEAAQKNIENQKKLLEEAKKVQDQDQAAYNLAPTPDKQKIAGDQLADSQKKVADIEKSIAQSKHDIAEAQQALEDSDKKVHQALKNEAITAFEEIGSAYVQMLQQQEEARERSAQTAMEWNKKELDSQTQSNAQKHANDQAYFIAQKNLERDRLNHQRAIAEDQMAIDYATAVMKIIASNAGLGLAAPAVDAIEIAGVTAIYFAKLAFMNSIQYAQGGDVPRNGGSFGGRSHSSGGTPFMFQNNTFEAEAGELAIINKRSAASSDVLTVTGTPKQIASGINSWGGGYDFAPGAKMYKFEWGGSLGSQIQPPTFVNDYYTAKASGDSQLSYIYSMVMENNKSLQAHAAAIHNRIDNLQVHLNPHAVSDYQKSYTKSVNVGKL